MSLIASIQQRKIEEVVHFTTNHGLVGTFFKKHLLSRKILPEDSYLEHVLHVNSAMRPEASGCFDKSEDWLDYVNLSISEINANYFKFSQSWHNGQDIWWAILAFDPCIITHKGVYFATTNNAYEFCERRKGIDGYNNLFQPSIKRKSGWSISRVNRANYLPTCQQAEVLYPRQVSLEYLKTVYVRDGDHQDLVKSWLKQFDIQNVNVIISEQKFIGMPN